MPREISEYSIWRSAIGATAAARRMVSGADLGQADVPDMPGLDQLGDGADGLLDRHVRVDAGRSGRCRCGRCRAAAGSRRAKFFTAAGRPS